MTFIKCKYVVFVFTMIGFLSCDLSTDASTQADKPFFDLLAFFAEEQVNNEKVKSFHKSIRLNDQFEQKQLDSLDLATELALFTKSDINKTAWLDKYTVDSIYGPNRNLQQLQYRAKEEKLNTRSITVALNQQGKVDSLMIANASKSMVAQSNEWLKYIPKIGYQIKHLQQVTSQPEHELVVDVKFVY